MIQKDNTPLTEDDIKYIEIIDKLSILKKKYNGLNNTDFMNKDDVKVVVLALEEHKHNIGIYHEGNIIGSPKMWVNLD